MSLALWRSPLDRALDCNRSLPYARYLQLATVRADGRPANRTLVFRGFLEDTNQLQFAIDARSEKVNQIQNQSWGEACWYFPETREQFRLLGTLTLVQSDYPNPDFGKVRQTLWQNLSDSSRLQFVWPQPGKPKSRAEAFNSPAPDSSESPSNFCLLLLDPAEVDHLELQGEPQNRYLYVQDREDWSVQAINP